MKKKTLKKLLADRERVIDKQQGSLDFAKREISRLKDRVNSCKDMSARSQRIDKVLPSAALANAITALCTEIRRSKAATRDSVMLSNDHAMLIVMFMAAYSGASVDAFLMLNKGN